MRTEGRVKWFNNAKGYGFIAHEQGDVFVYHTNIRMEGYRTLKAGKWVSYDLKESPKGLLAENVEPLPDVR